MEAASLPEEGQANVVRLHHGADLGCANDLDQHGVDRQRAAAWNGSGEFWATIDHARATWFAYSHPNSPPAACFEFDLPAHVLQALLTINPPGAVRHGQTDYEFLPAGFALLNQFMANRQVVPLP
jgi:hypothetical protein